MDVDMVPPIVEWLKIYDVWPKIFAFLDTKSLLNASLVCKSFNDCLSTSSVLKKLKISLMFPEHKSEIEDSAAMFKKLENHSQLTRSYKVLEIVKLQDFFLNFETRRGKARDNLLLTCFKLSQSVETLILKSCRILQRDLTDILRVFVNVRELIIDNIVFGDEVPTFVNPNLNIFFPRLKTLHLSNCDIFCIEIFKSHDNLESFELLCPVYVQTDVEILESFLLKQKNLKKLKLRDILFTNGLDSVPFQLTSLSLNIVRWETSGNFERFAKSQKSLKSLDLKIAYRTLPAQEPNLPFILQILLKENPRLKNFSFESTFHPDINTDLLGGIVVSNITQLSFYSIDKNSRIFDDFTQAFPNVKCLKYYDYSSEENHDEIKHMQRFRSLDEFWLVGKSPILRNAILGSDQLKTFKYWAINESKALNFLAEFIARNPNISDLSLFIEPITFEEISEILMNISSTLEVFTLSDLHLNPTEIEIIVQNFPQLRKVISDFILPPHIIEILNTKNIKFEKFTP